MQDSQVIVTKNYNGIEGASRITTQSPIVVDKDLYVGVYQKEGTLTAQLRQNLIHNTTYPSVQIINSLTDVTGLLSMDDFDTVSSDPIEGKESRVAWINVPASWTREQLQAKLDALDKARLYRILSNSPTLTDQQKAAVESADLDADMDTYANTQVVRFSDGHEKAGQIVPDQNGKVQYRSIFFSANGLEDVDNRNSDPADFYTTQEIDAEINEKEMFELEDQKF